MGKNEDVTNEDIFAMLAGDILPSQIHARRRAVKRIQKIANAQFHAEQRLDKFTTARLLTMRVFTRPDVFHVHLDESGDDIFLVDRDRETIRFTEDEYVSLIAEQAALRAVLSRRPHVPNKKEGENQRRAAATAHHGPKKKGGNKNTNRQRAAREQRLEAKQASRRSERIYKQQRWQWWVVTNRS